MADPTPEQQAQMGCGMIILAALILLTILFWNFDFYFVLGFISLVSVVLLVILGTATLASVEDQDP